MMTIIVVELLGIAAVAFMSYVFIAFCRDHPSERCQDALASQAGLYDVTTRVCLIFVDVDGLPESQRQLQMQTFPEMTGTM